MSAAPLDAAAISAALDRIGSPLGRPLSIAEVTRSTNDDARAAAAAGAPHGAAFLAEAQTAGRGRGGHAWHSPPGENLYLSVVLRTRLPAASIAPVTLALGLGVLRAVERSGAAGARIKWPNDVLAEDRKLAGILVEGQLRGAEVQSLVVGVGINVLTDRFPDELAPIATSLRLLGATELDRSELAALAIAEIGRAAAAFERDGLGPLLSELAARDALRGEPIAVGEIEGVGAGIDAEGRLLVRDGAGWVHRFVAGEVRRRPLASGAGRGPSSAPP